jgi:hypothetical protein
MPPGTGEPPDALELLRRESGLSIDDEGRFRHRGEPITHARTLEVLWRSLERTGDGRYRVRVGRESAYVDVPGAPYGVRGATPLLGAGAGGDGATGEPRGLLLHLTDGSVEPLDPGTVRLGPDGVLQCTVKGGHRARFQRSAQAGLGDLLLEERPGQFALRLGGRAWPLEPA